MNILALPGIVCLLTIATPLPQPRPDGGSEKSSSLYEDDAWYDVTEWFDGNDYHPTDEAIGRWVDPSNKTVDDSGADREHDLNWDEQQYGYFADNEAKENRWFYDFYGWTQSEWHDENDDGIYEISTQYYDYDNDGIYDAVAHYHDEDGDGRYEDLRYIPFSDSASELNERHKRQAEETLRERQSRRILIAGTVEDKKTVETRAGKHLVVRLRERESQTDYAVDLGRLDNLKVQPEKGLEMTVIGPVLKVGELHLLLTQQMKVNGKSYEIDQNARYFRGEIEDVFTLTARSQKHQLVKLNTSDNKKLLVDLGPANRIDMDLRKGAKLTVAGPAVKIKQRRMLIAQSVTDGETTRKIDRNAN